MNYNPLIDLALMGAAFLLLGLTLRVMTKKPTGATRASLKEIILHQNERVVRMMDGDYK